MRDFVLGGTSFFARSISSYLLFVIVGLSLGSDALLFLATLMMVYTLSFAITDFGFQIRVSAEPGVRAPDVIQVKILTGVPIVMLAAIFHPVYAIGAASGVLAAIGATHYQFKKIDGIYKTETIFFLVIAVANIVVVSLAALLEKVDILGWLYLPAVLVICFQSRYFLLDQLKNSTMTDFRLVEFRKSFTYLVYSLVTFSGGAIEFAIVKQLFSDTVSVEFAVLQRVILLYLIPSQIIFSVILPKIMMGRISRSFREVSAAAILFCVMIVGGFAVMQLSEGRELGRMSALFHPVVFDFSSILVLVCLKFMIAWVGFSVLVDGKNTQRTVALIIYFSVFYVCGFIFPALPQLQASVSAPVIYISVNVLLLGMYLSIKFFPTFRGLLVKGKWIGHPRNDG
jgi:hypothetical protein